MNILVQFLPVDHSQYEYALAGIRLRKSKIVNRK